MPVLLMPAMQSRYLQVPKVLPHRSKRSRSRSRQREPSPTEIVVSSPKPRPQTPPIPPPATFPPTPLDSPRRVVEMEEEEERKPVPRGHPPVCQPPAHSEQAGTSYDDLAEDSCALEDDGSAASEMPLRRKLIGAWKLESYIAYPTPASPIQRPTYPMTKNVTGFIMYTPDGYMSAQMLIPGQQSFKRGEGEEPQWAEAGKRFFGYAGPYYITDEGVGRTEILRHTFQVCNLPGWIGDIQVRTHRFEEDGQVLVLGSEEPTEIKVRGGPAMMRCWASDAD